MRKSGSGTPLPSPPSLNKKNLKINKELVWHAPVSVVSSLHLDLVSRHLNAADLLSTKANIPLKIRKSMEVGRFSWIELQKGICANNCCDSKAIAHNLLSSNHRTNEWKKNRNLGKAVYHPYLEGLFPDSYFVFCLFVCFGRERLYTGLRLSKLNFWVLVVCRSEWAKRSKRQLTNSLRWPIFIINSVDKITLSCNTAPPTQHQGFFRNLSPFVPRVDLW